MGDQENGVALRPTVRDAVVGALAWAVVASWGLSMVAMCAFGTLSEHEPAPSLPDWFATWMVGTWILSPVALGALAVLGPIPARLRPALDRSA